MAGADRNGERISVRSLSKLWNLFDEYVEEVNSSALATSSKTDYIMFAEQFVRWIDGDFKPGGNVK